jgi:hypothetical protein
MITQTSDARVAIEQRIEHVQTAYVEAERWSKQRGTLALIINLIVVILSAFVAFRGTTDVIFGALNGVILTGVSIMVAILVAVQATLQLERRSERASTLATAGWNAKYNFQSQLLKIAILPEEEAKVAELELLTEANEQLARILKEATALKIYPVLRFPSPYSDRSVKRRKNEIRR